MALYEDLPFKTAVSRGKVGNADLISFGATVASLDAADGEVAFYEAKLAYPSALSADTVYLVSSSASDTGTYKIDGTDANGDFAEATVTATGSTPVAFSGTWDHVQRCISTSADNVGTVYVSTDSGAVPTTTGDQIQTVMLAGANYAINPMLVCPNNREIIINRFDFSTDTRDSAKIEIEANRKGMWIQNFLFYTADAQFFQNFEAPIKLLAGQKLRVKITASQNGTNATFGMNGIIFED